MTGGITEQGWYVSLDGQPFGPLDIQEVSRRFSNGELLPGDHVWHAGIGRWITMRDALPLLSSARGIAAEPSSPAPEARAQPAKAPAENGTGSSFGARNMPRFTEITLRNGAFVTAAMLGAIVFFLLSITLLREPGAELIGLLFLLFTGYLGWWSWLEFRGVTFTSAAITYPARLPFWPHIPAIRQRELATSEVGSVTRRTLGRRNEQLIFEAGSRKCVLVFEDAFLRECAILALETLHPETGAD